MPLQDVDHQKHTSGDDDQSGHGYQQKTEIALFEFAGGALEDQFAADEVVGGHRN